MMIGWESFVASQEEDEIISSIIMNECEVEPQLFPQVECVLETILPPLKTPQHLEASQFLHYLLPHEMDSSSVS